MGNIDISKMGFSGRMGPVVAYVVNGQQRFRTYIKPQNPKTKKQTAHRTKFGFVSSKMSPLFREIKNGFKNNSLNFGTVCGKVSREAVVEVDSELSLDYSKIQIAEGKIQPPTLSTVSIEEETNIANFKWDPEVYPKSKLANENDKVNIVCFNESFPTEIFRQSSIKRKIGRASIDLPKHWNNLDTHFWIYFTSYDLRFSSDSFYVV